MKIHSLLVALTLPSLLACPAAADDPVNALQQALRSQGFYFAEPTGAVDQETKNALRRFQTRHGLPVNGEVDTATLEAVQKAAASVPLRERARTLEQSDREFLARLEGNEPAESAPVAQPNTAPATSPAQVAPPRATPADAPTAATLGSLPEEEARRFLEGYVHTAQGPSPDAEVAFYADRVDYFDHGSVARSFIQNDQRNYYRRWPTRDFALVGAPQITSTTANSAMIRFRLRYTLRSGTEKASGQTENLLQIRRSPDGLKIVGIRERRVRE